MQDLPPVDLDREVPLPRAAADAATERTAQHELIHLYSMILIGQD